MSIVSEVLFFSRVSLDCALSFVRSEKLYVPSRPVSKNVYVCTISSRREKLICRPAPSRKNKKYRPVPFWNFLYQPAPSRKQETCTIPFRRGTLYVPSRVDRKKTYRLVPSRDKYYTVPSRHDNKQIDCSTVPSGPSRHFSHTVPSRAVPSCSTNCPVPYRPVPSRAVPSNRDIFPRQTCQNSHVLCRLDYYKPRKALVILVLFAYEAARMNN